MHLILSVALLFSALGTTEADSLKIKLLKHEVSSELRNEMSASFKELKSDLDQRYENTKNDISNQKNLFMIMISLANVILFGSGLSIILAFRKNAIKRLTKMIDDALYKVEPTYMPIKMPAQNMNFELEKLKKLGFRDIKAYKYLDDSCIRDAVIAYCKDDDDARLVERFILDKNLKDQDDVIFIIYKKGPRVHESIFKDFVNVTYANTPLTLVQALFVARRGMVG